MNYPEPQSSGLPKDSVYQIAEHAAAQLGYTPGGDLKPLVEKIGGKIRIDASSSESNSGSIYVHGENNFEIWLPSDTGISRDRFTIAHELGHYILHFLWRRRSDPSTKQLYALRYDSSRAEWEANWFAAAFLMPEKPFKEAFRKSKGNASLIASQFGVSAKAAKVRAQALGLVTGGD